MKKIDTPFAAWQVYSKMDIDWNNLSKVKIANSDKRFQKHEVVKLLMVMKLLNKHSLVKNYIRIYTEFPAIPNRRADIYYENHKTKEAVVFEIQKRITENWMKSIVTDYKDVSIPFFKSFDLIIIELDKCPDTLDEIDKWLTQYLV